MDNAVFMVRVLFAPEVSRMKRYRYGNPKSASVLQKARPILLMFVGWNLLGFMAWKFLNATMAKNDPAWETRPEAERIAALTGSGPQSTVNYKYSVFEVTNKDSESNKDSELES